MPRLGVAQTDVEWKGVAPGHGAAELEAVVHPVVPDPQVDPRVQHLKVNSQG